MWQLDNRTPFAGERGWVRDQNGAEVWLVALKCTFDIHPDGALTIAEEQPPVLRIAEHNGEPGRSSLKFESDLVLTKTTTDIVVAGHAYAPSGGTVRRRDVIVRVGAVEKVLLVYGDRVWDGASPSSPEPFVKMPLVYERAFGGADLRSPTPERHWEWRNPVGTGFATSRANAQGVRLPNIEYPNQPITAWTDRPSPAGLGPVAGHWQPRVGLAGTYDEHWLQQRQPLVPADFDDRFYQTVPIDQQAPRFMRGGEQAALVGLTPTEELRFRLPRVFPGFETRFLDGSRVLHTNRKLHTVILEPDFPRVSVVWHSALPCHHKVHKLERTIVTIKGMRGVHKDDDGEEDAEFH